MKAVFVEIVTDCISEILMENASLENLSVWLTLMDSVPSVLHTTLCLKATVWPTWKAVEFRKVTTTVFNATTDTFSRKESANNLLRSLAGTRLIWTSLMMILNKELINVRKYSALELKASLILCQLSQEKLLMFSSAVLLLTIPTSKSIVRVTTDGLLRVVEMLLSESLRLFFRLIMLLMSNLFKEALWAHSLFSFL